MKRDPKHAAHHKFCRLYTRKDRSPVDPDHALAQRLRTICWILRTTCKAKPKAWPASGCAKPEQDATSYSSAGHCDTSSRAYTSSWDQECVAVKEPAQRSTAATPSDLEPFFFLSLKWYIPHRDGAIKPGWRPFFLLSFFFNQVAWRAA